jgi:hypothetical protein
MKDWIATTESGRTYKSTDGSITVGGGYEYFHNAELRSFPPSLLDELSKAGNRNLIWNTLNELPQVDEPVVGERLYVRTFGDAGWRISTPIVKIEWVG